MLFKEMYIESQTKEKAYEVARLYEDIIRLRTEARLKGVKPPFEKLSKVLADYVKTNRIETKF